MLSRKSLGLAPSQLLLWSEICTRYFSEHQFPCLEKWQYLYSGHSCIFWKWYSDFVSSPHRMSMHFQEACLHTRLQRWDCDPSKAKQSTCLWASKTCMNCRGPGQNPALYAHGPGDTRANHHMQSKNEANTVEGRWENQSWWYSLCLWLASHTWSLDFTGTWEPKTFFAKPFWVGLPVPWKLKGSRLIQSLLRFVTLNKLLYVTALSKQ